MAVRKGNAEWNGNLKDGKGRLSTERGALKDVPYNFTSRFEDGVDTTNPEEILGAAHAACFSMALASNLSKEGFKVNSIKTVDDVHLEKLEGGFTITKIVINTEGSVEGIDDATFQKLAEATTAGCPVSRALSVEKILNAKLV